MKILFHRFFYITHLKNLPSIRAKGLLSHNVIIQQQIAHIDIADPGAQRWRNRPETAYGRSIQDYVPLYINPQNPMLSVKRNLHDELVVLKISASVLDNSIHVYADGNAASQKTVFSKSRDIINKSIEVLESDNWTEYIDGKRLRCAEVLIYPSVQPMYIEGAVCSNADTASILRKSFNLATTIDSKMFFNNFHDKYKTH